VDDDENDRGFIVSALRSNGVKDSIHVASSGSEAIAYLKGEGKFANRTQCEYPDFLITDIKMPDGDGFSVLEHLRKNPEHAIIPTIVLSSSDNPNDIRKSYLLGANGFHIKPIGVPELRAQLKILYDYWSTCRVAHVSVATRPGLGKPSCGWHPDATSTGSSRTPSGGTILTPLPECRTTSAPATACCT
jgi:CheY-like chemotaxis protein